LEIHYGKELAWDRTCQVNEPLLARELLKSLQERDQNS